MKTLSGSVFFFYVFLMILSASVQAADKPTLESITFKTLETNKEQVTFKLNGTYIPKTFAIKGKNPRVVFDFPNTGIARTMPNSIQTAGAYVKRIRIGLHTGEHPKTRVVFDLTDKQKIGFKQHFDQITNALTILIFPTVSPPAESDGQKGEKGEKPVDRPLDQPTKNTAAKSNIPAELSTTPIAAGERTVSPTNPVSKPVKTGTKEKNTKEKNSADNTETKKTEPAVATPPQPIATITKEQPKETVKPVAKAGNQPVVNQGIPVLQSVTFDNTTNRGEMIQFKLTDFHPPTVFGIEQGLPRVVCDFPNTQAGPTLKNIIKANGRYVKTIRIGRHPDKIRVVIDLEANNNYDLQQVFFKEDDLFVIIVNTLHSVPTEQTERSNIPAKE